MKDHVVFKVSLFLGAMGDLVPLLCVKSIIKMYPISNSTAMSAIIDVVNTSVYSPFTGAITDDLVMYTAASNQRILFMNGDQMTPCMTISNNCVGIGTISPQHLLHVNGNTVFSGNMTISNVINLSGICITRKANAQLYNVTSVGQALDGVTKSTGNIFISADAGCNIFFNQGNNTIATVSNNSMTVSNLSINGSFTTSNAQMVVNGFKIGKPPVGGGAMTFTQQVTSIAGLNNTINNMQFQLSNVQTDFRFLNTSGTPIFSLSNNGIAHLNGTLIANNIIANNIEISTRNRLINGEMVNYSSFPTHSITANALAYFAVDRFVTFKQGTAVLSASASNINYAVDGFRSALRVGVTTTQTTLPAGDYACMCEQALSGFTLSDLQWGTASPKDITVQFNVFSNISTTFFFVIRNIPCTYSYVRPFTTTANTWTRVSFTVSGPPAISTWASNASPAAYFGIFAYGGSSYHSPSPNTWQAGNFLATSAATTTFTSSTSNFFAITGFQVEKGTIATSYEMVPFRELSLYPGAILQAQSIKVNPLFITSSTTYVNTGINISITPKIASSTLYVFANMQCQVSGITQGIRLQIRRDNTEDTTTVGVNQNTHAFFFLNTGGSMDNYLKVPIFNTYASGTTNATTFSIWCSSHNGGTISLGSPNNWGRSEIVVHEVIQ